MAEVVREEQHLVKHSLRLDEAEIVQILADYVATRAGVVLGVKGVTTEVRLHEVGARGVTAVQVVADVVITVDEIERAIGRALPAVRETQEVDPCV